MYKIDSLRIGNLTMLKLLSQNVGLQPIRNKQLCTIMSESDYSSRCLRYSNNYYILVYVRIKLLSTFFGIVACRLFYVFCDLSYALYMMMASSWVVRGQCDDRTKLKWLLSREIKGVAQITQRDCRMGYNVPTKTSS